MWFLGIPLCGVNLLPRGTNSICGSSQGTVFPLRSFFFPLVGFLMVLVLFVTLDRIPLIISSLGAQLLLAWLRFGLLNATLYGMVPNHGKILSLGPLKLSQTMTSLRRLLDFPSLHFAILFGKLGMAFSFGARLSLCLS